MPVTNDSETGFATLIMVILVAVVLSIAGAVGFAVVSSNISTTTTNVYHQQALQAAQSGIDATYQRIKSESSVESAPCGPGAMVGTLGSTPKPSTYSVTAKYYKTPTAKSALTCTQLAAGTVPKAVLLASKGKDGGQVALMVSEADLAVSPFGSAFGDAAYINAALSVSGADAFKTQTKTIYVHGNMRCGNGGKIAGTVVATGTMTLTGTCQIHGTAEAGGTVSVPSGSPGVGGTLVSFATTTPGIKITGNPTLHTVLAKTKIIYPASWLTSHPTAKIVENDSSLGSPPTQTFPNVTWTSAGWTADGYKAVATTTCAEAYKEMFAMHTAATSTGTTKPVALYTTCKIKLPQATPYCPSWTANKYKYYCTQLVLARTLIIFSTAGFDLATPFNVVTSAAGASHQLGLIVPTVAVTGAPVSCSGGNGNIIMTGKILTGVDTLFYTPCSVSMSGAAEVVEGEIYAGANYTATGGMSFGPPPTVPGATGGSLSLAGKASVGVVYVREAG